MYKSELDYMQRLFFALYLVLPNYFAIEINNIMPLLTAGRLLLLLYVVHHLIEQSAKIKFVGLTRKKEFRGILVYFVLIILCSAFSIPMTSSSIKGLFTILFEQYLLFWFIYITMTSKEKVIAALRMIMYASGVVALVSIISTIIGYNLFELLNTVEREMLISNYTRLGLMRAAAGFGHAVYYGLYNATLLPLCLYFIEYSHGNKRTISIIVLILDILALLLSNSRGSLLATVLVFVYMIITKQKKEFRKHKGMVIGIIILFVLMMVFVPQIRAWVSEIFISIVSVFTSRVSVSDTYGRNAGGLLSRLSQFSIIQSTLSISPIIGLGYEAQNRGVALIMTSKGTWSSISTFDSAIVSIVAQFGIMGALAYFALYINTLRATFSNRFRDNPVIKTFRYMFITYFIGLLTVAGLESLFWVLLGLMFAYIRCNKVGGAEWLKLG